MAKAMNSAMGLSFDNFGSYRTALSAFFSAVLLGAIYLLNSLLRPYPNPVRA